MDVFPTMAGWNAALAEWLAVAGQDHMSPVGMFLAADTVVQGVMVALALASVMTWAIFAGRLIALVLARARLRRGFRQLDRAAAMPPPQTGRPARGPLAAMIRAAASERDRAVAGMPRDGIRDRAGSALARIEAGAARRMASGTGFLANVGAVAPFVGLFGTVWGIMNSFVSIAETNTTNLAVVAPGIAEALLATGLGLVAAIPAVIFYNILSRTISSYRVMLADASALVQRTLSRDLDRGAVAPGVMQAAE